ncbi:MAG: YihA family ribosome biogenesis GTP-binding protein [Candidatus Riflebacteria bacterium]|jgi:GTP-binding protein|nr:YihA family ribosome biogenesis GTP-binding protein [Candidatus Riflebacteria bacterium]
MNITSRITSAVFSACITNKDDLPKDDLPIIALVGRSNVGKSSLINSLTGRKELARTSSMPGKTLTMNFYCINDAFYLVDLPGYGFAKASKATRNKIQAMMDDFFNFCSNLKGVVQIVDIRHKPSPLDIQMHNWLKEQHLNGFVVLTKSDKLSNQQNIKMRSQILKDIRGTYTMVYSSKTLVGRDEFLDAVEKIIAGFEFKVVEPKRPAAVNDNLDEDDNSSERQSSQQKTLRPKMNAESQTRTKPEKQEKSENQQSNGFIRRAKGNKERFNRRDFPEKGKSNGPRHGKRLPRPEGNGFRKE